MSRLAPLAAQIVHDWFGDDETAMGDHRGKWFSRTDAWDAHLRATYAQHSERAAAGAFLTWEETAHGTLALILLLDQFSRNIYRSSPRSFAYDAAAREASKRAIARGQDLELVAAKRAFVYMPFMHSEQAADHTLAVELFAALRDSGDPTVELVATTYDYELLHKRIIDRFGRYPHRNEVLGRISTAEEVAFLNEPNSSF